MNAAVKQKYIWIDLLKMLAILMVMLDHTAYENASMPAFASVLLVDCAVPVFFILVGYNSAQSYDRARFHRISQWYQPPFFTARIRRLMVPYLGVLAFEIVYKLQVEGLDLLAVWERIYQRGGWGPGSYFPFVMLQVTVLIPVILYGARKHWKGTVLGVLAVQILFEILTNAVHLDSDAYRMLVFRYLTCVLLGILFCFYEKKFRRLALPAALFLMGIAYLAAVSLWGYEPLVFRHWNTASGIFPAFYAFGIVYLAYRLEDAFQRLARWLWIPQRLGQASYHIFLVQMMFFHFKFPQQLEPVWNGLPISAATSLAICCVAGLLWYEAGLRFKNARKGKA